MIEKTNTQLILEWFFDNPTTSIHLRELSRKLKLSMPTIIKGINKLQKNNLIIIEKTIVVTNIKANLNNKKLIQLKKVNNLEKIYTSGLIEELNKKIPKAIILFGSYAFGEDVEESDIDIAIISKKTVNLSEKFEKLLKRKISLHQIELNKVSKEFKTSLYNGIVLEGSIWEP